MLKLPSVFSSGALFLHSAPLTVSGESDSDTVTLSLTLGRRSCGVYTVPVTDGCFSITFNTPSSSFKKYQITVTSCEDTVVMTDILFGELFNLSAFSVHCRLVNLELS